MTQKDKYIYLEIMMESICKIQEYTNSMDFETFDRDNKTIDACLMQFQHL
jgi:uncharacterized protein with HEPN domain